MALWRCRRCTTRFAVGLPYCPQCTSTDYEEDSEDMAKISRHGGPTDQLAEPGQPGYQPPSEEAAVEAAVAAADDAAADLTDGEEPETEGGTFEELTVAKLRGRLRARGLSTAGSKDDLRDRLAQAELHQDTS